ncbi:MAG: type II toxin-antitoxin system HipA family toxin [Cryomorphaceae bacterium]|nr:MAG: type II toxin-antitoxin system HipA family toxin [Cryomorphaceae bacterium]
MSSAKVTIWNTTVGYLTWDESNNAAVFEPDPDYLKANFNLSPVLHANKEEFLYGFDFHTRFEGMIPLFNDSLPDSFGNIVFKEWAEHQNLNTRKINPVERLLYTGHGGIGALEYHVSKKIHSAESELNPEELALISDQIIKGEYHHADYLLNPKALQNILSIGSSVGGAQAKVLLAIVGEENSGEQKFLAGDQGYTGPADYFIVKLEHDRQNLWSREKNRVEFVYNQMARNAGINVAESRLIFHADRVHFASKRFDRVNNQKLHKQTVNALTGFFGRNNEFGYEDIFRIMAFLKLPYPQQEQLFLQMTFNVLASNRDDHTKNFSFLMNPGGQWSLSPAYDLTYPLDPYQSFDIPHKISINQKVNSIQKSDLQAVARKVGIKRHNELIERVATSVQEFTNLAAQQDISRKTIHLIGKEIARNLSVCFGGRV